MGRGVRLRQPDYATCIPVRDFCAYGGGGPTCAVQAGTRRDRPVLAPKHFQQSVTVAYQV